MIIHEFEQRTPEWFEIRRGKMTASNATAIGNNGKGLETYILELMADYFSQGDKESYSNSHTERGNELEEQARNIYELEYNQEVKTVGFIEHSEFAGCSPDGLIGDEGGWECKCPSDKVYFKLLLDGEVPTDYLWQVQMNLLVTGRAWWDLTFYNPNYTKPLYVKRIYPDQEMFRKLLVGFEMGEEKIKAIKSKMEIYG